MSTTASGRMRARDLDRAHASGVLDAAYAEGQLGADEYHDRTAKAAAAKTLGELEDLVADLQSPTAVTDLTEQRPQKSRNMLHRRRFSGSYPGRTRAREVDRAATVRVLDGARADGQLTADEHEAFTELAAAAKTLGELTELVSDLQRRADAAAATAFASARLVPGRRRGDRGTRGRDGFPRDRSRGPRAAGKCDRSVTLGGEVLDVRPPTE